MPRTPDPRTAPPLRWGIIAPGGIARAFVGAAQAFTRQQIVAVGSQDAGRAERFAKDYGIPRAYGSYQALVADPEVEAVYVASPHSHHYAQAKLALEADKADLLQNRKELGERQSELAEQYGEADKIIAGLMKAAADKQAIYNKELEAEKEAAEQIAKAEAEWKKQQEAAKKNTAYVGGEFGWPVPGYEGNISSPFGWRKHPILKDMRMHNGIDISAPKSAKITASNAGTVILTAYNSGYGNYVVVDHGGGYTTLYAHMTKFAVSDGTKVGRGDTIGYVGSTGLSTGPHLHFEIRVNGSPKNPEGYLRKQ